MWVSESKLWEMQASDTPPYPGKWGQGQEAGTLSPHAIADPLPLWHRGLRLLVDSVIWRIKGWWMCEKNLIDLAAIPLRKGLGK